MIRMYVLVLPWLRLPISPIEDPDFSNGHLFFTKSKKQKQNEITKKEKHSKLLTKRAFSFPGSEPFNSIGAKGRTYKFFVGYTWFLKV